MKRFEDYNPVAIFFFFVGVTIPTMFCMNFYLLVISYAGACTLDLVLRGRSGIKSICLYLAFPILGAIINPIFNHNGMTILFMANDSAITFEAAMYGLAIGGMISTVLLWFKSFSYIMTTDKLLYVFGSASPKLALILSMTLRYIPLYKRQIKKVQEAQTAMGLYKQDSAIDRIRGGGRVFSIMVTWGLENGVVTADSMSARGYGATRRSRYAIFRWRKEDVLFLVITLIALVGIIFSITILGLNYRWYPSIKIPEMNYRNIIIYFLYTVFVFIPSFINIKEVLVWKSLQSRI